MTISQIMQRIPSKQKVDVREYINNERLEIAAAEAHCEFLRNDCCIGFDKCWEVYSVSVEKGILTIKICPPENESE